MEIFGKSVDSFRRSIPEENFSIYDIRRLSGENGTALQRIHATDLATECTICGSNIEDRFGIGNDGLLICHECLQQSPDIPDDIIQKNDPTEAILSESGLYHKNLCNYVINVATGCSHGCKFCYVPSTPNIKTRGEMLETRAGVGDGQQEWGEYVLYRDDLPERLHTKLRRKRTWKNENGGRGIVMLSSGTDCYQDRRAAQITRGVVIELVNHGRPVRILTRSPAVVRDKDVFKAAEGMVTVGSSIPNLNDDVVRAIEAGAPPPSARLKALEELSDSGIPVYVSMSPTYPTHDKGDLRELMTEFQSLNPDVIFHEPINPRGTNFDMTITAAEDEGFYEVAKDLKKLKSRKEWVEYSLNHLHWVEELAEELDLPIHLWPDKALIGEVEDGDEKDWLVDWLEKDTTPEDYPNEPKPL